MNEKSIWYLENIDVSNMLSPTKMADVMDKSTKMRFKKGAFIYMPEDDAKSIYFITGGKVKITSMSDNKREITKAILNKGEIFGELTLAGEEKRRDFAKALEEVEVCILSKDDLESTLKDYSALSMFFMKLMGSRVLEMEKRLQSLVFKDSRSRIIEFLKEMVRKKGEKVGFEYVIRNFITHQEIANLTATSRQTVTTVLNELRNENIITFDRRRLLVRDLDKLEGEIV